MPLPIVFKLRIKTMIFFVSFTRQRKNALQASIERREVCLEFGRLPENSSYISISHCSLPSTCVERDFIPKTSVLQELVCLCFAVSVVTVGKTKMNVYQKKSLTKGSWVTDFSS